MLKDFIEKLSKMKQTPEASELLRQSKHLHSLFEELSLLEGGTKSGNLDPMQTYLDKVSEIYEEVWKIAFPK